MCCRIFYYYFDNFDAFGGRIYWPFLRVNLHDKQNGMDAAQTNNNKIKYFWLAINGMANFILGRRWVDPFRFKCAREASFIASCAELTNTMWLIIFRIEWRINSCWRLPKARSLILFLPFSKFSTLEIISNYYIDNSDVCRHTCLTLWCYRKFSNIFLLPLLLTSRSLRTVNSTASVMYSMIQKNTTTFGFLNVLIDLFENVTKSHRQYNKESRKRNKVHWIISCFHFVWTQNTDLKVGGWSDFFKSYCTYVSKSRLRKAGRERARSLSIYRCR